MSINVDLQYVTKAEVMHHDGFSVVRVSDGNGSIVKMYFKEGNYVAKSDAVADTINCDWTEQ